MGCHFPLPMTDKDKDRSNRGSGSEALSFTDLYTRSIHSENESEKRKIAKRNRLLSIEDNNDSNVVAFELDRIIRNDFGKVMIPKVKQVMAIKLNYPEMKTNDIIVKFNKMLKEHPMEEDELESSAQWASEENIEPLSIKDADVMRGSVWKSLTKLDSYKQNDFMNYQELTNKAPTEYDAKCISLDLLRVVPNHVYYSKEYSEGLKSLKRVLESLSIYHENLGYFNSIGFIVAILLLYLSEEDAFWMANYLLDCSMIRKWVIQDRTNIRVTSYIYQKLCMQKLPKVYSNLKANYVNPILYSSSWFMTLFCAKFEMECALRILDMLFVEGYICCFKLALAILKLKSDCLETGSFEDILLALSTNLGEIPTAELFEAYQDVNVTPNEIKAINEEYITDADEDILSLLD